MSLPGDEGLISGGRRVPSFSHQGGAETPLQVLRVSVFSVEVYSGPLGPRGGEWEKEGLER